MPDFLNSTGTAYAILEGLTNDVTGSLFMSLLMIVFLILAFSLAFRIPMEYTAIFILPILIVSMAYFQQFLAIGGVILIYLGVVMAKNFFFK